MFSCRKYLTGSVSLVSDLFSLPAFPIPPDHGTDCLDSHTTIHHLPDSLRNVTRKDIVLFHGAFISSRERFFQRIESSVVIVSFGIAQNSPKARCGKDVFKQADRRHAKITLREGFSRLRCS